jgi:hypothetical protein
MDKFKGKMIEAWNGNPPRIKFITQAMPGTPNLRLSGSGCTCDNGTKIENFIKDLERDLHSQSGRYYAYVMGGCQEEADTYFLEGWEVWTSDHSAYEYMVILYYSAMNPYLAIKKHMGEDMAERHLAKKAAQKAIADALA